MKDFDVLLSVKPIDEILNILKEENVTKLYIEIEHSSLSKFNALKSKLTGVTVQDSNKFDNTVVIFSVRYVLEGDF